MQEVPKKSDETYLDYQKRMIDSRSPSFCAAKWLNATIWLGHGRTTSCHHPPAHKIDTSELATNPSAIHNTRHKKQMRKMMLEGSRPSECDYCWKIEDIKRDNISDRVFKTEIYQDEDIMNLTTWDENTNLKTLELAFDSHCNFACSYCNGSLSTKWVKDIKDNGPYQKLRSKGGEVYKKGGTWPLIGPMEPNPYIEAFWQWWPTLSESLTELRVTGGEPLLSGNTWKLIDFFADKQPGIRLSINSNLGVKDTLIDRLIERSHQIPKLAVYTSCEAFGNQAEYIRDGLDFEQWTMNVEKLLSQAKLEHGLHVMMTINSLCLFSITELLDVLLQWKKTYGASAISWSVNILRFPSFMSPLTLPDHLRALCHSQLKQWFIARQGDPLINEMEVSSLERLLDYLDVVKEPHRQTSTTTFNQRDFKVFFEEYDRRRGKDFMSNFKGPLAEWYQDIDTHLPLSAYSQEFFHRVKKRLIKESSLRD